MASYTHLSDAALEAEQRKLYQERRDINQSLRELDDEVVRRVQERLRQTILQGLPDFAKSAQVEAVPAQLTGEGR